jgi:hypothetical protein
LNTTRAGALVQHFCCHEVDQEPILIRNNRGGAQTLSKENEIITEELAGVQNGNAVAGESGEGKKAFVEPAISVPVDVLEATTFFQAATSGVIN